MENVQHVICKICNTDLAYTSGDTWEENGVILMECPYCMNTIELNKDEYEKI